MNFEEALEGMRMGWGVYRESWDNEDVLYYNSTTNEIEHEKANSIGVWKPTHDDIVACDWKQA